MNDKPQSPFSDAMYALLAFRHGDTKHLTREHAGLLYEHLQEAALPATRDMEASNG
jgi:hypothetical protein